MVFVWVIECVNLCVLCGVLYFCMLCWLKNGLIFRRCVFFVYCVSEYNFVGGSFLVFILFDRFCVEMSYEIWCGEVWFVRFNIYNKID